MPLASSNKSVVIQVESTLTLQDELGQCGFGWLTTAELARYHAINSSLRKVQFLAGHYLVRKLASQVLGCPIEALTYFQDSKNLRRLNCAQKELPELYLSISHSGEWIVAAISENPVGVDIETYVRQRDFLAIARYVFSQAEVADLEKINGDELKYQFYLYWTLKECLAKQNGLGLKTKISRAQTPTLVSDAEQANLHSWQNSQFVLSLSTELFSEIEFVGNDINSQHKQWCIT